MEFLARNYYFFVTALTGLYALAFAAYLTVRIPASIPPRSLMIILLGVFLWSMTDASTALIALQVDPAVLEHWAIALLLPVLLLPVPFFYLIISLYNANFPGRRRFRHKGRVQLILAGLGTVVWAAALLRHDLLFRGFVTRGASDYSFEPGPLFLLIAAQLLVGVLVPALYLMRSARSQSSSEQLAVAWGALVFLAVLAPTLLLQSTSRTVQAPRLGCLSSAVFFTFVFVAVYRHGSSLSVSGLVRGREKLERFAQTLRGLVQARDQDQVFQALCEDAHEISGSALVCIVLFGPEGKSFTVKGRSRLPETLEYLGKLPLAPGRDYPLEGTELGRLCEEDSVMTCPAEPFLRRHLATDQVIELMKNPGFECLTGYPVVDERTVKGAVIAFRAAQKPGEEFLGIISAQCSLVLKLSGQIRVLETKGRLEQQLEQFRKMEAIGRLAGGIAHDFNNLLSGISGYAALIKRKYAAGDPKLMGYVDPIVTAAQRAADLTGQLLAFARRGTYQPVEIDSNLVVEHVVQLLSRTIDRRITIKKALHAASPTVIGDPGQVESAVLNIALNGRDAMIDGGELMVRTDNVRIAQNAPSEGKGPPNPGLYVAFTISDTGTGMDEETKARMFEPFFTTKEKGKGTGLGLASVYGSISSHNGHIEVESSPGKGTTVRMFFPAVERASRPRSPEAPNEVAASGAYHILVVDDEPVVRSVSQEMLEDLGYSVSTCCDGMEAIEFFKIDGTSIDLAIIDMIMPKMGGHECVRELRKLRPDLKIIISTGYSVAQDTQQVITAGISAYLQKPFDHGELSKIVADTLASG